MSDVALFGTLSNPTFGTQSEATFIVDSSDQETTGETYEKEDGQGNIVLACVTSIKSNTDIQFTISDTGYPAKAIVGAVFTPTGNHSDAILVNSLTNSLKSKELMTGSLKGSSYGFALTETTATTTT